MQVYRLWSLADATIAGNIATFAYILYLWLMYLPMISFRSPATLKENFSKWYALRCRITSPPEEVCQFAGFLVRLTVNCITTKLSNSVCAAVFRKALENKSNSFLPRLSYISILPCDRSTCQLNDATEVPMAVRRFAPRFQTVLYSKPRWRRSAFPLSVAV